MTGGFSTPVRFFGAGFLGAGMGLVEAVTLTVSVRAGGDTPESVADDESGVLEGGIAAVSPGGRMGVG